MTVIVLAIVATSYQVMALRHSDDLDLKTPKGSVAREADIEHAEISQEAAQRTEYERRFIANSAATDEAVKAVQEAGSVAL